MVERCWHIAVETFLAFIQFVGFLRSSASSHYLSRVTVHVVENYVDTPDYYGLLKVLIDIDI